MGTTSSVDGRGSARRQPCASAGGSARSRWSACSRSWPGSSCPPPVRRRSCRGPRGRAARPASDLALRTPGDRVRQIRRGRRGPPGRRPVRAPLPVPRRRREHRQRLGDLEHQRRLREVVRPGLRRQRDGRGVPVLPAPARARPGDRQRRGGEGPEQPCRTPRRWPPTGPTCGCSCRRRPPARPATRSCSTSNPTSGATSSRRRPATMRRPCRRRWPRAGTTKLAGIGNTAKGFAKAFVKLRDLYAPNVLLAYHGVRLGHRLRPPLQPDLERPDRPARRRGGRLLWLAQRGLRPRVHRPRRPRLGLLPARREVMAARHGGTRRTSALWALLGGLSAGTGKRVVVWQVPMGNTLMRATNDTWGHYADNRPEWFLDDVSDGNLASWRDWGVVALLFGGGAGGTTCACDGVGDGRRTRPPPGRTPAPRCRPTTTAAICVIGSRRTTTPAASRSRRATTRLRPRPTTRRAAIPRPRPPRPSRPGPPPSRTSCIGATTEDQDARQGLCRDQGPRRCRDLRAARPPGEAAHLDRDPGGRHGTDPQVRLAREANAGEGRLHREGRRVPARLGRPPRLERPRSDVAGPLTT